LWRQSFGWSLGLVLQLFRVAGVCSIVGVWRSSKVGRPMPTDLWVAYALELLARSVKQAGYGGENYNDVEESG